MVGFEEIAYHCLGKDDLDGHKHVHPESFEIIQTWSDGGTVLIKDKIYPINKGSLFFISAGTFHFTNPENADRYVRNKIILSKIFLEQLSALCDLENFFRKVFMNDGGSCFSFSKDKASSIDRIFQAIAESEKREGTFQKSEMISLLLMLFRNCIQRITSAYVVNERIAHVLSYIDNNLENKLTFDELCNVANVSRYYFSHLFKKTVGMTVSQYVMQRKLAFSMELLQTTDLTVSEIAMSCGFSSFSYFSRKFRDMVGCSPQEYRKQNENNNRMWF